MNNWYNNNHAKQMQEGIYNLLVKKHGIDVSLLPSFVDEFISVHMPPASKGTQHGIKFCFDIMTGKNGFGKFLSIVTKHTGVKFKLNNSTRTRKRELSYDEWFQQGQMDGSFAYNGVTDDF